MTRNLAAAPPTTAAPQDLSQAHLEQRPPRSSPSPWHVRPWLILLLFCTAVCGAASAQTFQAVPALAFTKGYGAANPLPEVFSVASTGAALNFSVAVVNGTGGTWLTLSHSTNCCYATPQAITATAAPAISLAAGSYTAQVVVKAQSGSPVLTIPVSLTVAQDTAAFFDALPGALTFSLQTSGTAPPAQLLPIRNGGSGALSFTSSVTTADGGSWLHLSQASGPAPASPSVSIDPAKLPGGGVLAGTYVGQVLLQSTGDAVTVPVTVTVGDSVLRQIDPLFFSSEFSVGEPPEQVITLDSTHTPLLAYVAVAPGTGGKWLSTNLSGNCCYTTPQEATVSVSAEATPGAGTYTSELIFKTQTGAQAVVIPVTFAVLPYASSFLTTPAGALTFSMQTGGTAPPAQILPLTNGGSGALAWTASQTTSDGGKWLTLGASSGTTPSSLSATLVPANLPGGGKVAGTFTGEVLLRSADNTVTVPVTVTIGDSVFRQANSLSFTKLYGGANPPAQVISIASTGAPFNFAASVQNATGGNWLSLSTSTNCCYATPQAVTVTANPAVSLAAGIYTAQIVLRSQAGDQSMVVPVSLTVEPATATFFDALPGELTFSMLTAGTAPPPQLVPIRNAGSGTLSWTGTTTTADGGKWLALSASGGTAPYLLNVSINPASLPGQGKIAGTYTGQVVLQTAGDTATIPVSVTVGSSVLRQINPLSFTKVFGGADPLPQVITATSTGSSLNLYAAVVNSTGGNWLALDVSGNCCYATPHAITVAAHPNVNLAAGTYTAEIVLKTQAGDQSVVVPVTLTVRSATTAFFDTLPSGLTFSGKATGSALVAQALPIRNAGAGVLNWVATTSTADGSKWLAITPASGAAPQTATVSVNVANLPGKGLIAGSFTGQVLLQAADDIVTVPVTVTLGDPVFQQPVPLTFTKAYGGANPAAQTFTLGSTGAAVNFYQAIATSTGGSWFTTDLSPNCCYTTPRPITITVAPATNLAAGVYTGEIIVKTQPGTEATLIPVSLTVTSTAATATPTFTPPGGSYSTSQTVTLLDSTRDAAIYYSIDGSTPTTASPRYVSPIAVTATSTVKAIAIAPGYPQSPVATAAYTITAPVAATPAALETITISEATANVTVYYTTNGSTPTTSSTRYTGPLSLSSSSVLKFIAIGPGNAASPVRTVSTTIQ